MQIWENEIRDLNRINNSLNGAIPELEKELGKLVATDDENMILIYARRCLEVIITHLCQTELKRQRGSEPLQRIIDKLKNEQKVPQNIIVSMFEVNNISTFGAHPKEFDIRQIKPVLTGLETIIFWYIDYRDIRLKGKIKGGISSAAGFKPDKQKRKRKWQAISALFLSLAAVVMLLIITNVIKFSEEIDSIAILPFDNFTGDDNLEFFVAGMHSSLINDMGKISGLRVIGKTSSNSFKNSKKSVAEIASELDVDAVVESEVLCIGDSICVQFNLINAKSGEVQIWGGSYKEEKSQILNLYNKVTGKIANELKVKLTKAEKDKLGTDMESVHPDVLEAYFKGMYSIGMFSQEAVQAGIAYLNEAIDIDPTFAPAHAALGGAWATLKQMDFVSTEEAEPKIREHLGAALKYDNTLAEVYFWLGGISIWTDFDWEEGERNFKKALNSKPNYPEARAVYSHYALCMGRWEEAREQINIALELDRFNPLIQVFNGMILMCEEDYTQCINLCESLEKMMPTNPLVTLGLLVGYAKTDQDDMAIRQAEKWISQFSNDKAIQSLRDKYKESGLDSALNAAADELVTSMDTAFISAQKLFVLYSLAGNTEKTLFWLERGFIKRDPDIPYIAVASYLKPYREEPRFKEIVKNMKLNPN